MKHKAIEQAEKDIFLSRKVIRVVQELPDLPGDYHVWKGCISITLESIDDFRTAERMLLEAGWKRAGMFPVRGATYFDFTSNDFGLVNLERLSLSIPNNVLLEMVNEDIRYPIEV